MKLKMEDLKKIPLRIVNDLQEIKEMEEKQKSTYRMYRNKEIVIRKAYIDLERLIKNWNEE